mgnify:CR=1 FL=1
MSETEPRFKGPAIAVVVPVHNGAAFLQQCLASLAAQTFGDFACFVVDDGSTDASPALCDARAAADERPEKQRALGHALPASRRGELVVNTDDSADHADCDEVV